MEDEKITQRKGIPMKIDGGATIWARQTVDSEIFYEKPDKWFKIWFYIVNKVNFMDNHKFRRGQNFIKYQWIEDATGATKNQVDMFIRWAKEVKMLTTQKTTRGMIVNVLKYEVYQDLENYGNDTENETKPKQKRNRNDTILKNDKKDKNEKNTARVFLDKKGNELPIATGDEYQPDGWSPRQEMDMRRRIAKSLGVKRSTKWSQLLFGSAWDFKKAFLHFQGYEYPDTILLDEVSKTLAKWYELGETRESVREMMIDFFQGSKAKAVTITPNSVFSSHTYNSWKQGKL